MNVYAIADLHFDNKKEKPMNIFGDNWICHEEKIINNWKQNIKNSDLILLPGDISWAVKLEDAKADLLKIDELPGIKIIGKGNHDYWWATSNKLDNLGMKTINFLKNNFYEFDDVVVCGTRGWDSMEEHSDGTNNEKIFIRELNRFKMSLEKTKNLKKHKIAMLHYPPFNSEQKPNEFFVLMKEYKINTCIYGHLHGEEGHKNIVEGNVDGIDLHCVACDYLDFNLKKIK